ncbi:MAG: transposase [Bacteroidetes bacterium]|nr:transposase [Bacteroidota bacterium]
MASKIAHLSELESVLCNNEKTNEGVLHFFSTFKIGRFLGSFGSFKSKGVDVSVLLLSLLIFRLRSESIFRMQNRSKNFFEKIDDNTFYRLMNNSWMDWRKLLMGFAKQFAAHVKAKGDLNPGISCFVLDDTDIEKTGKTIEFIGRVFNHVTKLYPLGFKLLLLGFWDGKTLIATDYSLHREKGKKGTYGLTKKELKSQFSKRRNSKSPGHKRVGELDMKKGEVAVSMLKRAVKNGFLARYVLMDSWFVNDYMIKNVRAIKKGAMHLLGMCRLDKRKYLVDKKEVNAHQLITKNERKKSKYSRKYKSTYISMVADYKGVKVRLFFIRYNNAKNWTILLTTDLTLSFVEAIELYQVRWTIEVLFKECKQYLRLGGSQNTDFDGQVADITITLATHTILSLQKRFSSYETMGELFRETQQHLLELTLWERLVKVFLKMVVQLAMILNVDVEEIIEKIMRSDQTSKQLLAILKMLDEFEDNDQNNDKTAIRLAVA